MADSVLRGCARGRPIPAQLALRHACTRFAALLPQIRAHGTSPAVRPKDAPKHTPAVNLSATPTPPQAVREEPSTAEPKNASNDGIDAIAEPTTNPPSLGKERLAQAPQAVIAAAPTAPNTSILEETSKVAPPETQGTVHWTLLAPDSTRLSSGRHVVIIEGAYHPQIPIHVDDEGRKWAETSLLQASLHDHIDTLAADAEMSDQPGGPKRPHA